MQATRYYLPKTLLCFAVYLHIALMDAGAQQSRTSFIPQAPINETWNARRLDSVLQSSKAKRSVLPPTNIRNQGSSRAAVQLQSQPGKLVLPTSFTSGATDNSLRQQAVCYVISGRDFMNQDSLYLYTGTPCLTKDGHVLLSGEYVYYDGNMKTGGFCIKSDTRGNMVWAKMFDSIGRQGYDFVNYFEARELNDGSVFLTGRTNNNVSGNSDIILTRLDASGNLLWTNTYESRFWQGFNGSGDVFGNLTVYEDAADGALYFVGYHWGGLTAVTRLKTADGSVVWSRGYKSFDSDYAFGLSVEDDRLVMISLENGYYNDSFIDVVGLSKVNGDTLFTKNMVQTGDRYAPRLYSVYGMTRLDNGNYRVAGPTTGYYEYPAYTGTKDLFHAGIVELDRNFNLVRAYGFRNRVQSNVYNSQVSLFADGTGVFTMLNVLSGYNADAHVSIFKDDLIFHQRKREHRNEGLPEEPKTVQLPDGGYLNVKVFSDSTKIYSDGCQVDFHRMHIADTASQCLGLKDSVTSLWYFNFEPTGRRIQQMYDTVIRQSSLKTYTSFDFYTYTEPSCQITSSCDTLKLKLTSAVICPGTSTVLTVSKNKGCGSLVPLRYDTSFIKRVVPLSDSTYELFFSGEGRGYLRGSLMGCTLIQDSVFIEVLPARFGLDLGADTVICPGNTVVLNAKRGFNSYRWQDGSTDSIFTVTGPGKYFVEALNGCGGIFSDTIIVSDHPPIPLNIGADQSKCNDDTLTITATPGFINYTWSSGNGIIQTSGNLVRVNPAVDAFYSVVAEKSPGCFAYDTTRVIVFNSPPINLGSDTSICFNDTLLLDAGNGFSSYHWSTGASGRQLQVSGAGSYQVYAVSQENCISRDTFRVLAVYALPRPDLGPDSVLCAGRPRILASKSVFDEYLWSTGANSRTITVDQPAAYWLKVTDANGCSATDTTVIPAVQASPYVSLGADTALCSYGTMQLKPSGVFAAYRWNTGSVSPSITISSAGAYSIQVTDLNTCTAFDTIVVKQKQCLEGLYIPSAFSPNGDGVNDQFIPMLFGDVKYFRFQLYNRWGQLVFETNTPGRGWNGSRGGINQEAAVFVWTCTYQLNGQDRQQQKGRLVLIR